MISFTLLLLVAAVSAQIDTADIPLIDDIDVPAYLGLFYQMYTSPIILQTFEKDGFCFTATYGLVNSTTLSVYNHMLLFSPDGPVSDIYGVAVTSEDPAKLNVYLDGAPKDGEYWIMELGPVRDYEVDGELVSQYSWSLVTDSRGLSLFVLARDVDEFEAEFEADILGKLAEIGFTTDINRPVKSYHGDDCAYPEA